MRVAGVLTPEFLQSVLDEVGKGLPTEGGARRDRAREGRDLYKLDYGPYASKWMNDAETGMDYIARPHRMSAFTRKCADILCEHLYAPGPVRKWDDAAGDEFLQRVYDDNHINALMQRADVLSTVADCAAIQVDAASGTFESRPFTLRLWGADEFLVWEDPDDRLVPLVVCTIDRYDAQTRYRVWTAESVYTLVTGRGDGTAGGRVATPLGPPEPNPYGVLPFAFVHYALPVNDFWEPGISGLLVNADEQISDGMSRIAQAVYKHLNPIPIARDAPDGFQLILGQPNLFIRLNRRAVAPGADGAFGGGGPPVPELSYLQASIDVQGAWEDLHAYADMVLEAARVPRSAVRMEQTGVASGISLMVEQAPLLTRARRRQLPFSIYEEGLARTILACAGAYYGRPAPAAGADAGHLALAWPMPTIPVPTDDWLNLQLMREQAGLTSKIMITMEDYGVGREQAIGILERVAEDNELLATLMPASAVGPQEPPAAGDGDDEGDPGDEGNIDEPPDDDEEEDVPVEADD